MENAIWTRQTLRKMAKRKCPEKNEEKEEMIPSELAINYRKAQEVRFVFSYRCKTQRAMCT